MTSNSTKFKIVLASPRGFCAGVERAVAIVELALVKYGAPVYVRHEVVHNRHVVNRLRNLGAVFVDELVDVPNASILIYSAHGVSQEIRRKAQKRGLTVFDATCPLVTKVHMEVARLHLSGKTIIMIGHKGHPEVDGTMGQIDRDMYLVENTSDVAALPDLQGEDIAYVTQTTLSVDDTNEVVSALRKRFPNIIGPRRDDICYATQNRQVAVKKLAQNCQLILVVGSPSSSNSRRLQEVAQQDTNSYLIESTQDINPGWLPGVERVGLTAGASAPENVVDEVLSFLSQQGGELVKSDEAASEPIVFSLPPGLTAHAS